MEDSGLRLLRIENLRCLSNVEINVDPHRNVIYGANGAGKTSILEAIYFLSRGKSFRAGDNSKLIKSAEQDLTVFGEVFTDDRITRLGIKAFRGGTEIHLDGQKGTRISELAAALPVQVIDPESHMLIQGGPAVRRQFLDWGVFHVEHDFLLNWQKYKRLLQQRNAAIKLKQARDMAQIWDKELISTALMVDRARRAYLEQLMPLIVSICNELLGIDVKCIYRQGWSDEDVFEEALKESWGRDSLMGFTQVGPHRAEIAIQADGMAARNRLSRGQQKLLSIAMVLAQSLFVAQSQSRKVVLLVDEPAAELDKDHQERLLVSLDKPELQLFISALDGDGVIAQSPAKMFHVKRGEVSTLI
ncbi:MAG: DNA replication/repair protein RecF [Gammaproteobacteria bacterium]|nr:DNA replication/repair protein RecF [Gammaproteobacteria bacterium]